MVEWIGNKPHLPVWCRVSSRDNFPLHPHPCTSFIRKLRFLVYLSVRRGSITKLLLRGGYRSSLVKNGFSRQVVGPSSLNCSCPVVSSDRRIVVTPLIMKDDHKQTTTMCTVVMATVMHMRCALFSHTFHGPWSLEHVFRTSRRLFCDAVDPFLSHFPSRAWPPFYVLLFLSIFR